MSEAGDPCEAAEEAAGPSVESADPRERIAARRLRVAARRDAGERQEQRDDTGEQKEVNEKMTKSQQEVEESEKRMVSLQTDGTVLVTNIQTAAAARESQRRAEMQEAGRIRLERLESEARSSLERFEQVSRKWAVAQQKALPQELLEALNSQQLLCDLILEQKNKLITELQQDLKASDDRYVKDLKKQAEEIDLMIERMEEQNKTLTKAYREELEQMENVYEQERSDFLTGNRKKWEALMIKHREKELENLRQRMRRVEETKVLLHQLRVAGAEDYNMMKRKLDRHVQALQLELQQKKASYQLIQEQLDYSHKEQQKREEEENMMKAQQKRKINRWQDLLNKLKAKCCAQKKQAKEEIQSLTESYERAMQQYEEVQRKIRHFSVLDAQTLEEVWQLNEAEVKQLVERALDVDRLIHEQLLGLTWVRPHLSCTEPSGPARPQQQPQKTAHQAASRLLCNGKYSQESLGMTDASVGPGSGADSTVYEEASAEEDEGAEDGTENEEEHVLAKSVTKVLELLCDEGGFLIESRLLKLLSPLEKDERSLLKLDSIFSALGIESEEDVYKMAKFFIKYRPAWREQFEGVGEEEGKSRTNDEEAESNPTTDLIHPDDVLTVLKAFTAQQRKLREGLSSSRASRQGVGDRTRCQHTDYWEAMADVLPGTRLKIWDALEKAQDTYHGVLNERSQLITDTQTLRQQNSELRMLLQQFLHAKVDA